ncbi:MAG: ParA family protein [Candidatus Competibacteraceae bacterium]|nr:ParA family protein [Candidatus Competibacteraceae bacterium]
MMHTLTLASTKGGCGKSTLAIHLAVCAQLAGRETLLADLDPHSQTVAEWAGEREQSMPTVIRATADDIHALQHQAESENFDLLVLDCPPYLDAVAKAATAAADFTLIPAQPRFADIRVLPRVIETISPPFAVVLNACTPGLNALPSSKTLEVMALLQDHRIPVASPWITRREAFADALNGGQAVQEFDTHGKAAAEIHRLWDWLQAQWA